MAYPEDGSKGAAMKIGRWAGLLAAATLLAGCGDFWQAPGGNSSFTLTNGGAIEVIQGNSGNSVISVTPGSSFSGTVTLSCAITTSPSGAANLPTCSLSSSSLTFSSTAAQTSTLTASTAANTTLGTYNITVTGVSGSVAETTTVCLQVSATSTSTCSATASSGNFYVLNQTTSQIVALRVSSGQPTTIGAVTTPTVNPLAVAVAPNGNFLYVSTLSGIYLYTINSNGSLTLGNGGLTITSDPAYTMQVDSTNSWLVDAVSGSTTLYAIAINSSTGALATSGEIEQPFSLPASTPIQLAISPGDSSSCANCYVFVALGAGGTEVIHFNPSNSNPFGTYGNQGLVNSAGGANTVAVDPSNRLLYIGETAALSGTQSAGLRVFTIGNTGITELTSAGSPYATGGTGPTSIQPSADGNYVYVANGSVSGSSTGNITSFSVTATSLTSIGSFAAGSSGQLGLSEDSTGNYLLAVDLAGSPDLQAYTMSSGTLTSAFTSTTGSDPVGAVAIAAAP